MGGWTRQARTEAIEKDEGTEESDEVEERATAKCTAGQLGGGAGASDMNRAGYLAGKALVLMVLLLAILASCTS